MQVIYFLLNCAIFLITYSLLKQLNFHGNITNSKVEDFCLQQVRLCYLSAYHHRVGSLSRAGKQVNETHECEFLLLLCDYDNK